MVTARLGPAFLFSALGASALTAAVGAQTQPRGTTAADARAFLDQVDRDLGRLGGAANRAGWIHITTDTKALAAQANQALVSATTEFAKEAAGFQKTIVPEVDRRQLELLRTSLTMASPPDPKESEEITRIAAAMEAAYGRGKYCPAGATGDDCLDVLATRFG